ncbi:MAG: MFS transporter [Propionibacteriaceae bacterium]
MIQVLRHPTFARLFGAQVVALLGTGLMTIALGLLAFDLAGADAGIVLGTALTIKMVAYVGVSPITTALTAQLPRKPVLITADLIRALAALSLPFVSEIWQIYLIVFILQASSATFTPTFQAVIPQILPDERTYTRALSLSRLAYDLEALVSPALAALLLLLINYHQLFAGTFVGFIGSAVLVATTTLPRTNAVVTPFRHRLFQGAAIFFRTPALRGLMTINLVATSATAMVLVNTVVLVQGALGRPQPDVALLLACYGAGSMATAICLPRILDRFAFQRIMIIGAIGIPAGLALMAFVLLGAEPDSPLLGFGLVWLVTGVASSMIQTPSAQLLRRSSTEQNRAAVFAAQFSFSHGCLLITYPLAGNLGALLGLAPTAFILSGVAALAAVATALLWRTGGSSSRHAPGNDPRPGQKVSDTAPRASADTQ